MSHKWAIFAAIVLSVFSIGVRAQDNVCDPNDVVLSFADAVRSDTVDDWLSGYVGGNCSDSIKAGATALFDSYQAMVASGASEDSAIAPDQIETVAIPISGDNPVIRVNDVLGLEKEVVVGSTGYEGDAVASSIMTYAHAGYVQNAIGLRIDENTLATIPYANFRTLNMGANAQATITLANGLTLQGLIMAWVIDSHNEVLDLANTTEVTLLSLPEEPTPVDTSTGTWLLEMPDGESHVVTNPRLVYRYSYTRSNCIGACGATGTSASTDFEVEVNGQQAQLDLYVPDQIGFGPEDEIDLILPNGNEVTGTLVLNGFRKHLAVDLIEEGYTLIVDIEGTAVTLTKQA